MLCCALSRRDTILLLRDRRGKRLSKLCSLY